MNDQRTGLLLVIADLGAGGAQQVLTRLANSWAARGHRVGVVTLAAKDADFFRLDERVARYVLGGVAVSNSLLGSLVSNARRVFAIRRALKEFGGDTAIGFIAPTNVLLILATRFLGYRVVISERNDPSRQSFGRAWDVLRRLLYRRADFVSANSRGALKTMRAYVPEEKLVWLPNPIRLAPSPPKRKHTREKLILNVGRLHEQKGQDFLIRAFACAANQLEGWRLCILGEGRERIKLEALIASLGVQDSVKLKGHADDPFFWYRRASIFAFPSRWEGSPNALIEAMSCGVPPVVCDGVPGVLEIVRDGRNGRVIPAGDKRAFANALIELAGNGSGREKLGREAVRAVRIFAPEVAVAVWDRVVLGRR